MLLALIGAASAVYVSPLGYSAYGAYPYAASVYSAPVVSAYSAPIVSSYSALPYHAAYVAPAYGFDLWKKKKAA